MFNRSLLIGHWFRTVKDSSGARYSEIAKIHLNGQFEFTFLTFDLNGNIDSEITELGDWGLVGDIHFTITKSERTNNMLSQADRCDADNYHAYRVLTLNQTKFVYAHVETGEQFSLQRIEATDTIN